MDIGVLHGSRIPHIELKSQMIVYTTSMSRYDFFF